MADDMERPSFEFARGHGHRLRGSPVDDVLESLGWFAETAFDNDPGEPEVTSSIEEAHRHVAKLMEPIDLNEVARLCYGCDEGMGAVEHGCQADQPSARQMLEAIERALATRGLAGQHRLADWEKAERHLARMRSFGDTRTDGYVAREVRPAANRAYTALTPEEQRRVRWVVFDGRVVSPERYLAVDGKHVAKGNPLAVLFVSREQAEVYQLEKAPHGAVDTLLLAPNDPSLG